MSVPWRVSKSFKYLLHELHLWSICFHVKFKVLVLSFKTLYGMGPDFLGDCFFQLYLSVPPDPAVEAWCGYHLLRGSTWRGLRDESLLTSQLALWNILPPPTIDEVSTKLYGFLESPQNMFLSSFLHAGCITKKILTFTLLWSCFNNKLIGLIGFYML